jgi:transposase-like protein
LRRLWKSWKRHGQSETFVTDRLAPYGAALEQLGAFNIREIELWLNNQAENSHQPIRRREWAILRFRRIRCLQKFAAVNGSIYNQFASWTYGSRIDSPPQWPFSVKPAQPDQSPVPAAFGTILVCLTTPD